MPIASLFRSALRSWRSLFAVSLAFATAAFAQSPSAADGFDPNVDGNVYAVALQPDGKLLLAGSFSRVRPNGTDGDARGNLARLNADGSLDTSFTPNANGPVRTLVLQADGKILIGGEFTSLNPTGTAAITRNRLARLNANGTVDTAFDPNVGGALAPQVNAILPQAGGRMIIGGSFTSVGGVARNRIARVNADGSLDTSYDPNANNVIFALAQHVDGKIIVAGGFTSFSPNVGDATLRNRIARLNANGTVDSEFDPNLDNRATALAIQRDGKILVGGDFSTVQPIGSATALTHNRLLRLNADGTLDTGFTSNASANVGALAVQPDGSVLAGGAFTTVWSAGTSVSSRPNVARFKPDGSVDLTFNAGANSIVSAFAMQPDGKLIIAGYFTGLLPTGSTAAVLRNRVARLNVNGSLDATFHTDSVGRPLVQAVQRDGKIIIGGSFTSVGGATHNRLARLNPDGSVDATFNPDINGLVLALAVQPTDQKIIVGGAFTTIGGEKREYIARLNPSGTIDSEFAPNADGSVAAIALQSDGKIIIGGSFSNLQPIGASAKVRREHIARLNANGTVDTPFHPNADSNVFAIALQSDGKILVGGVFTALVPDVDLTPVTTTTNGVETTTTPTGTVINRNAFARLNADGTIDTAFNANPNSTVTAIAVQGDGKILITGSFTGLRPNGATTTVDRNRIARLNTDGTLDTTYNPNANELVLSLALQPDGKALIGGPFTYLTPNGAASATLRKYAARLNTDGTVDTTFNLDLNEVNGNRVDSWLVQPDGKILLSGNFTSLQPIGAPARVPVNHFARLNANGTLDTTFTAGVGGSTPGTINTLVLQSDGKLIAAGSFTGIGGATTANIARFNAEGTPDTSFATALASDGPINAVLVRPGTTSVAPQSKGLAWLNGDGTLRASFAPDLNSKISGTVLAFAVQSDGAVIVGGTFTTATGIPGPNLIRYNPDGSLDANFGPGPNGAVTAIAIQPDGKIVVAGTFTTIGGTDRAYIARLTREGTIDTGFNPVANARVNAIALQADGNIILGGLFTSLNPNATTTTTVTTTTATPNAGSSTNTTTGTDGKVTTTTISTIDGTTTTTVTVVSSTPTGRNYIARVKADGTLDTAYNPNLNNNANALVLQADGKLVVGGAFTTVQPGATGDAVSRNGMVRLNADGTVDTGYDPNPNGNVNALALYLDGKIIVGGSFTTFSPGSSGDPVARQFVARLNTDGTIDSNFDPRANNIVLAVAVQANSKVLIGGQFSTLQPNGAKVASGRNGIARVDFDGTLDTAFDPNSNGFVSALATPADGSVLIGGSFTALNPNPPIMVGGSFNTIGGVASRNLALLGDDGSANSVFQPNPNGAVNALLVQTDVKIVVAGAFTTISGTTRNRIARYNTDFTLDTSYNPNANGAIHTLALQPDGKLVIGGAFTTVGGTTRNGLARLNTDGTLDSSFSAATGIGGVAVRQLAVLSDGRILVLSDGSGVRSVLTRVNADGSADSSFTGVNGGSAVINSFAVQGDGRILVAGAFTAIGGANVARTARLNANGTVDTTFNPVPDAAVTALALQTDGRLVIGGNFTAVGGLPRGGIARLATTTPAMQAITATSTSAIWARTGASPEVASVVFEQSSDANTWTRLGTGGRVSGTGNWQLSGLSLPTSGLFYLRARGVTPSGAGSSSGVVETAREFNLAAVAGVGPASGTVATLDIGGVLIDAATGLLVGEAAPSPGSGPAISAAPIGAVAVPVVPTATNGDPLDSRLVNFSARARVSGSGALITGFAISGPGSHTVLLRAAGPTLGAFGVTDVLAQPRLLLYNAAGQIVRDNTGWTNTTGGTTELVSAMVRTGAFPFAANGGRDSATVVTLAPGAYSMQVLDAAGATGGVALAEVYDAGSFTDSSRLMNISLRGDVNAGNGAFISGFIITGNAPKRLLVRGTGPALAKFNVAGALADPVVSVFNGQGHLITANDNWSHALSDGTSNATALAAASRSVGAFALDSGSKDAALTLTLVPGTYTVQVAGAAGATGTALIEVYELP